MKCLRFFLVLIVCFTVTAPAKAGDQVAAPTKESLIAAWEEVQKGQETTVVFEKTGEPGIYNFETTLFPYKGKLKILNAIISKDIEYYYNYDIQDDASLTGFVEVELSDAPDKFFEKYPVSTNVWRMQNYLFFINDTNQWMSKEQWNSYLSGKPKPTVQSTCGYQPYQKLFWNLLPILIAIPFLFLLIWRTRKIQKAQIAKYDVSLERQVKGLQQQEEEIKILKEILGQLKK